MADNSVILGQIESLNSILQKQQTEMDNARAIIVDIDNYITGYQAQRAAVDPSKKKDGERAWYDNKITELNHQKQTQLDRISAAQAAYNDALAKLEIAKKNLTEPEKQALNSGTALQQAQLAADVASTSQKTTIYLIWGAVALVIIIAIGLILYKKYSA